MITLASSLRVYLACGITDMRKGMTGLAMLVQQTLAEDPFGGAVFAFRGRRAQFVSLCSPLVRVPVGGRPYRIDSPRRTLACGRSRAARLASQPPTSARRLGRARLTLA